VKHNNHTKIPHTTSKTSFNKSAEKRNWKLRSLRVAENVGKVSDSCMYPGEGQKCNYNLEKYK